jgi:hypothetical protein
MIQLAECLLDKFEEVLSSIPSTAKKKKKDQGEENLYNKENCSLILITGLCCMDGWLEKPFY